MSSESANPILVESRRGTMVESFHRGAAVVIDADLQVVAAIGNVSRPIYPRSAIKPLQALVLVESGALEHYGLHAEHIALACASHSGEVRHTDGVRRWLEQLTLDDSALECGAQYPAHRETRVTMLRAHVKPTAVYNNCSGKHAGFITVARYLDEAVTGYTARDHPVQQLVLNTLQELTGESVMAAPSGLDGCGIPVVGISLTGMARAFARLASRHFVSPGRMMAADRIGQAMAEHPELVGGTDRLCTAVPVATAGRVLIKVGAQGVYAGFVRQPDPLGFALKIDDGSRVAAEVAVCGLMARFCDLTATEIAALQSWARPEVNTVGGRVAGVIGPAASLIGQGETGVINTPNN